MLSPAGPYATIATGAAGVAALSADQPTDWIQPTTIAGAVIVVSLFWIRRADVDQRRERREMRAAIHRYRRLNAELLAEFARNEIPLPDRYTEILAEHARQDDDN